MGTHHWAEVDKVSKKDGDAAMTEVVNTIRRLEATGEIVLVIPGESDDPEED